MGFFQREVHIEAKKPVDHAVTMTEKTPAANVTTVHHLERLRCDFCGNPIADGTPIVAFTTWNSNREDEPRPWEEHYGRKL